MDPIAGRFLPLQQGAMADVASAELATWRALGALADAGDERRWMAACGTLAGVWHEHLPPLVEFGRLPDGSRYEAFEPAAAARPWAPGAGALAFLRDVGLADRIEPRDARPCRHAARPSIGITLVRRAALERVAELLDGARSGRPIVVGYVAEPGAGVRTWLRAVSREAATRGFAPVSVRALRRWPALERWAGERHVLLLANREDGRDDGPERALVRLALISPRGHVLLRPARRGIDEVRVVLAPLDPEALTRAVHVWPGHARQRRAIAAAAERSGGYPGRFIAALRGSAATPSPTRVSRVAEARPEYHVGLPPPLAPDVSRWIERGEDALAAAARGRHARARRALLEVAAALRRRGEPVAAARLEVGLGRLLLAHGAAADAETIFRRAHGDLDEDDPAAAAEAIAGAGAALIERGSLESAEAILRAARERPGGESASLLLSRCLAWQARYDEAERTLTAVLDSENPLTRGEALGVLARIFLGRHVLPEAGRAATLALAEVGERRAGAVRAEAHEILAHLQGRIADGDAARSHVAAGLAAAREARLPLQAIAIRLAGLEAAHRSRLPVPARLVSRVERLANGALAPLLRARIASVLARVHPDEQARAGFAGRAHAFVRASGARALEDGGIARGERVAQEATALIALLAREPDPRRLLEESVGWVRAHLDAAAVAIVDAEGRTQAADGRAGAAAATRRAMVTRLPIPPYLSENGIECAVPIEHAGELAGALGARWTIDARPREAAMQVLLTAASCAGPALSCLRDRVMPDPRAVPSNGIVGRSTAIVRLQDAIRRAAGCPFQVLIEGESGAGKELVARALHAAGPRRLRPFQAVNCAAFQDDLFEAELFGHARGAFTGAYVERPGLFEQADGGTLFLDEVSELTSRAQAKLLRALQEGEIRRVGENISRRVDVRVITASNRPLAEEAARGRFRQDLLFRIAVIKVAVPALRDRPDDIPLLAAHFWQEAAARTGSRATLTSRAVGTLAAYEWPGNVRELQNVIAALAVQVPRGRVEAADVEGLLAVVPREPARTLEDARRAFERAHVAAALARCGGRHAQAARELGITRQGLAKLMRRLGAG